MPIFILSYDLIDENGSSADYQKLYDELDRLSAHRVQASLWLLKLNNTSKEVIDHFMGFADANDKFWVSSISAAGNWFKNANSGTNKWLQENTPI